MAGKLPSFHNVDRLTVWKIWKFSLTNFLQINSWKRFMLKKFVKKSCFHEIYFWWKKISHFLQCECVRQIHSRYFRNLLSRMFFKDAMLSWNWNFFAWCEFLIFNQWGNSFFFFFCSDFMWNQSCLKNCWCDNFDAFNFGFGKNSYQKFVPIHRNSKFRAHRIVKMDFLAFLTIQFHTKNILVAICTTLRSIMKCF